MKLMTEITAGKNGGSSFGFSKEVELLHDAAAAHAMKQAIDNRMQRAVDADRLQEQVVLGGLLGYADEIMRTWGFEPEAGK